MKSTFRRMMTARQKCKLTFTSRASPRLRSGIKGVLVDFDTLFKNLAEKESSMDYEMTIYFQQKWTDERLAWGKLQGG